jgi:hypothetical protein
MATLTSCFWGVSPTWRTILILVANSRDRDAAERDGSGEGVLVGAVNDARFGGCLRSGVVGCAAMGDPEGVLVDVDLV